MIRESELFEKLNEHYGISSVSDLRVKKRDIEYVYSRMIVAEYYRRNKIHPKDIGELLNRDRVTIFYTLQKFQSEYATNKQFREIVDNIFEE